ncbi:MAG: DUF4854 domain-containing protein [Lachnoclostridium sp.]|nr:DUF4854 domain-containing protein [Lachnospira sp.]MCM1247827.1 DUF4854 domain-containing protein [Lachnoclostridium sp.]MCM1535840.1 DUF4854 domain-containing protein [Clostridium sp.]
MKKKFLIILLSLLFIFSLTGCGSARALEEPPQTDSSDRPAETDSSENISTASAEAGNPSAESNSTKNNFSENNSTETVSKEILSLQDWLDSENKEQNVAGANAQLNPIGLSLDFYAEDDNILVLEYTFSEQQDLGDDMAEIQKTFYESLASVYSDSVTSLFNDFESEYGIILADIKLVFLNADDTELYFRYYKE